MWHTRGRAIGFEGDCERHGRYRNRSNRGRAPFASGSTTRQASSFSKTSAARRRRTGRTPVRQNRAMTAGKGLTQCVDHAVAACVLHESLGPLAIRTDAGRCAAQLLGFHRPPPSDRLRPRLLHLGNQPLQVRQSVQPVGVNGMPELGNLARRTPFSDRVGRDPQHR